MAYRKPNAMPLVSSRALHEGDRRTEDPYLKLLSCGKSYHVYFINHESASTWVRETVQRLETSGYICCHRGRDFVPGRTNTSNIIMALENSIKFVVVITKTFLRSTHCQYELDLALDECMNRKDEITDLIPIIIESCELPRKLQIITALDISLHEDTWMDKLKQILDEEQLAEEFQRKLKSANLNQIMSFLCRPVAMELSHFLSQHGDLRMFISAMETCGISFNEDAIQVRLSILTIHLQQEHDVAQCFSEHVKKVNERFTKARLLLSEEKSVVVKQHFKTHTISQFEKFVKACLETPEDEFWGVMWNLTEIQMTRKLKDECREMIHDAVNELEVKEIAHPEMPNLVVRFKTFINWSEGKSTMLVDVDEVGLKILNNILLFCNFTGATIKSETFEEIHKMIFIVNTLKNHRD